MSTIIEVSGDKGRIVKRAEAARFHPKWGHLDPRLLGHVTVGSFVKLVVVANTPPEAPEALWVIVSEVNKKKGKLHGVVDVDVKRSQYHGFVKRQPLTFTFEQITDVGLTMTRQVKKKEFKGVHMRKDHKELLKKRGPRGMT